MARRRFYVPKQLICGQSAALPPEQAHHLRDVLRLSAGDEVEIFDGEGAEYAGAIESCGREVRVGQLQRVDPPRTAVRQVALATALIKLERFEWLLEKATELGVSEFIPLVTRYCSIRIPGPRAEARMGRWRRIATEASRQCGRSDVPVIRHPVAFDEFLRSRRPAAQARYLLFEGSERVLGPDCAAPGGALLCVGPEGGWDPGEVKAAVAEGFAAFSLGPQILRSETAAIAAAALFLIGTAGMDAGAK